MTSVRILLVDDDDILREVTTAVLNSEPGLEVVGEACDGREAVEKAAHLKPDVILLDMRMPGMTGEETAQALKRTVPASRIIALSAFTAVQVEAQILRAGADLFVQKDGESAVLVEAITRVTASNWLSPPL